MKVHVLCPFYRIHFAKTLLHYYRPEKIEYYPIVAPKEDIQFGEDWVHSVRVKELEPGQQCLRKFNDFIETQEIHNDDYYGFACDETVYEPGFFDMLRRQTAKIVMCSSYRGDSVPRDGSAPHPATPLIIKDKRDIRAGHIGLGQYFITGEILRYVRFGINSSCSDGHFAEMLRHNFDDMITFLPNWFVFANYLQPGRFTRKDRFLKPHWELPRYV
jgi:hypothetical protein